jgi:hypothetical protein
VARRSSKEVDFEDEDEICDAAPDDDEENDQGVR